MGIRRIAVLAGTAVLAAAIIPAAQAASASSPAETAVADVSSGPFHVQIQAQRAAGAPANAATGFFQAHGAIAGLNLLSVAGPVTCLDVRGNRMGLFYPITSSDPALFARLHSGVFVTIQLSRTGKAQLLGFLPAPVSSTKSCAPGLAPLPITGGSATLTP